MLKTKDGYSKVVGTTYQGSSNHLLLSNGGVKSISDFALSNHTHSYLPLAGGTMDDNARISTNEDLYIGNPDSNGWLYLQDVASQDGYNFWSITTNGYAEFENVSIRDNISVTADAHIGGQITRKAKNGSWVAGRDNVLLKDTTSVGYHPLWSLKTKDGSWEFGEYCNTNWYNIPVLSYITDTNYVANNNQITYQQKFQLDSGTIALTKNIPNPTNYYWANIKVSASSSTTTSPIFEDIAASNLSIGNKIYRSYNTYQDMYRFEQPLIAAYGEINLGTLTFNGSAKCTITKQSLNTYKISFDIRDVVYKYLIFVTPTNGMGYINIYQIQGDGRSLDYNLTISSSSISIVQIMLVYFGEYTPY